MPELEIAIKLEFEKKLKQELWDLTKFLLEKNFNCRILDAQKCVVSNKVEKTREDIVSNGETPHLPSNFSNHQFYINRLEGVKPPREKNTPSRTHHIKLRKPNENVAYQIVLPVGIELEIDKSLKQLAGSRSLAGEGLGNFRASTIEWSIDGDTADASAVTMSIDYCIVMDDPFEDVLDQYSFDGYSDFVDSLPLSCQTRSDCILNRDFWLEVRGVATRISSEFGQDNSFTELLKMRTMQTVIEKRLDNTVSKVIKNYSTNANLEWWFQAVTAAKYDSPSEARNTRISDWNTIPRISALKNRLTELRGTEFVNFIFKNLSRSQIYCPYFHHKNAEGMAIEDMPGFLSDGIDAWKEDGSKQKKPIFEDRESSLFRFLKLLDRVRAQTKCTVYRDELSELPISAWSLDRDNESNLQLVEGDTLRSRAFKGMPVFEA